MGRIVLLNQFLKLCKSDICYFLYNSIIIYLFLCSAGSLKFNVLLKKLHIEKTYVLCCD